MEAARPVMVVLQVVGAVPGQLDREADALGDRDRLGDRVRVEPAAVSLTGRPTRWEIATASATGSASSLRPKPPPMRVMFTWTFSGAVPSTFEASLRAPSGSWVGAQTSARSPCTCARQFWGSRFACEMNG